MKSKKGLRKNSKQIKSKYRKSTYGEVYTNEREVKAMCDLIPESEWAIEKTFLEKPAYFHQTINKNAIFADNNKS